MQTSLDSKEVTELIDAASCGSPATCVSFSPCASLLGLAAGESVKVYETATLARMCKPVSTFFLPNPATALAFSSSDSQPQCHLCVAHRDGALLWIDGADSQSVEHEILDDNGCNKRCIVFDDAGTNVAIAVGSVVCIVCITTRRQTVRLEGHNADVTAIAFSNFHPHQLCSASEDRTFKLWDISARCLLYQSSVVSSSPFTSIAFDPKRERVVLGSEDGKVRFYAITHGEQKRLSSTDFHVGGTVACVREEQSLDVGTLLQKRYKALKTMSAPDTRRDISDSNLSSGGFGYENDAPPQIVSSLPRWAKDLAAETAVAVAGGEDPPNDEETSEEDNEFPKTVLSLWFRKSISGQVSNLSTPDGDDNIFLPASTSNRDKDCAHTSSWKNDAAWLIVGTPCALLHVNSSSFVADAMLDLRNVEYGTNHDRKGKSKWLHRNTKAGHVNLTDDQENKKRGILSPLTAQAMAVVAAQQQQPVPLQMTAACLSFVEHANGLNTVADCRASGKDPMARRETRRMYYTRRLSGRSTQEGEERIVKNNSDGETEILGAHNNSKPNGTKSGLLCAVGVAFLPGIKILHLPLQVAKPRASKSVAANISVRRNRASQVDETSIDLGGKPPHAPSSGNVLTSPRLPDTDTTQTSKSRMSMSRPAVDVIAAPEPLSLFPSQSLPSDSVLRNHEFRSSEPTNRDAHRKRKTSRGRKNAKSTMKNKPVTFHTRIRSSGYGKTPPVMKLGGVSRQTSSKVTRRLKGVGLEHTAMLSMDSPVPSTHQLSHQVSMDGADKRGSIHTGPVIRVVYSRGATDIATASADRSSISMRLPCAKYPGEKHRSRYLGHNGAVHSVDWSHNKQNQLLLTASADGTAKLWQKGRPDAVLTFSHWHHGSAHRTTVESGVVADAGSIASLSLLRNRNRHNRFESSRAKGEIAKEQSNPPFHPSAVTQAGFFYMDKFVLLTVKNSLCLYKYGTEHLTDTRNDLRRLQNRSKYKMVHLWQKSDTHNITSFACANSFHSPIVITAGSNRSVCIYDLAHGREASVIADAHSRALNGVALPSFSEYTTHSPKSYDTFLTSGTEGSVKLWDLRTAQPIRSFQGQPRSHCMAMDPTMRFIACSSKDAPNVVTVYDMRAGGLLEKLQCGSEAVMDAAFSPRHPQLCVASADGRIRFFA